MASHGIKDRVAIVGMGCTSSRALDKGADDLLRRGGRRGVRLGRGDQGGRRRLLARHRAVRDERHHPRPAAQARGQAGHPGGELLRHRFRGAAAGRLRGRQRRLRHRDGDRRGEGQGLRLPGTQRLPDPQRRHRPDPDGGGNVLDGRARPTRKSYGVDHDEMRDGPRPDRVEEPRQRRPQPQGAVPQGDVGRAALRDAGGGRRTVGVRLRRRRRRRGRGDRRAGPRTPTATPTSRCSSRRCRSSPAMARGLDGPGLRLHALPRGRRLRRGRLRPGRHHRSRATSWPWPRCTTASRRPSSC